MTASDPTLIESVSVATRKTLVAERIAAMRGQLPTVCTRLEYLLSRAEPSTAFDRVAIGMFLAELLHLDGRDTDAVNIFNRVVTPLQPSLPPSIQLVARENLSALQLNDSPLQGTATFYHLVDSRRLAQSDASQNRSLLAAHEALESGRPSEALPLLWQAYLQAYSTGNWRQSQRIAGRIGQIYLTAGAFEQALHYLVSAEADHDIPRLAASISQQRDPAPIRRIVAKIVDFANLRRHFTVACALIASIPDLIPDEDVVTIAEWLLPHCTEEQSRDNGGTTEAAWKAIRALAVRIPSSLSTKLINTATNHSIWLSPLPNDGRILVHREALIVAVTSLVHSAPREFLPSVAEATFPLATTRRQDFDYTATINLMCNVSVKADLKCQSTIRKALYHSSQPTNCVLAQAASTLGAEAFTAAEWNELAVKVSNEIRLIVQRQCESSGFTPVNEAVMTTTRETPTGLLQVVSYGATGLEALARGKAVLSEGSITCLVSAMIDMIKDADNDCMNKERLLELLGEFADCVSENLRHEVIRMMEPIARGEDRLPDPSKGDPLSPVGVLFDFGSPLRVQSMALVIAAIYCGSDASSATVITDALTECFTSPHMELRRGAYAAARRLPWLSGEQLIPILMGLRDSSPEAATAAFVAFAVRKEWTLTRPMWKMFLLAVRLASQSPDSNIRRHAALALQSRRGDAPTESLRSDASDLIETFANDISWSVRQVASPLCANDR